MPHGIHSVSHSWLKVRSSKDAARNCMFVKITSLKKCSGCTVSVFWTSQCTYVIMLRGYESLIYCKIPNCKFPSLASIQFCIPSTIPEDFQKDFCHYEGCSDAAACSSAVVTSRQQRTSSITLNHLHMYTSTYTCALDILLISKLA